MSTNPTLHPLYASVLREQRRPDPLPATVRARVAALLTARNESPEADLPHIDAQIVAAMSPYVLHPDEVAREVLRTHRWRSPLKPEQAEVVLLAIAECGYDISGNGAPDDMADAAQYWAERASRPLNYVSLGDARGYLPRTVQYDAPGSMHPQQQAALTFGPLADRADECDSHGYMRRHTRRLVLVRPRV